MVSQSSTDHGELVRVSVAAGGRTVDLALPARIPVAELVPELVSAVGSLDPYDVYAGYGLVTADGTTLDGDDTLLSQAVHDGAVLNVVAGVDTTAPKVYDDVIEAVADAVEKVGGVWSERASRATALWVAGLMLLLGALTLLIHPTLSAQTTGIVAAATAGVLVLAGAVFGLVRKDTSAGAVCTAGATVFAVITAYHLAGGGLLQERLALAGGAAAVIGLIGVATLGRNAWAAMPSLVVGVTAAAIGAVLMSGEYTPGKVVLVPVALAVIAASSMPLLSLSATRTTLAPIRSEAEILADPDPIDFDRVSRGVELSSYLSLGLSLSLSLLIALGSILVVGLGLTGLLVCWSAAVLQILNTRRFLLARDVAVGVVGGLIAFVVSTLAALALHPDWRNWMVIVLAVAAALLFITLALPSAPRMAWARAVDIIEVLLLIAIIPLTVIALDLIDAVR